MVFVLWQLPLFPWILNSTSFSPCLLGADMLDCSSREPEVRHTSALDRFAGGFQGQQASGDTVVPWQSNRSVLPRMPPTLHLNDVVTHPQRYLLDLQTAAEVSELLRALVVMRVEDPVDLLHAVTSFQEHCMEPGVLIIDGIGPMLQELRCGSSQHKQGMLGNIECITSWHSR
jgi:hypothetical protein